jgi:hypothetical protein
MVMVVVEIVMTMEATMMMIIAIVMLMEVVIDQANNYRNSE